MLRDARAARRHGTDIVAGYLERHGRAGTAAQLGDLEIVPTRELSYRGSDFYELDVKAVITRRPQIALVDELAHANLPVAENSKRWEDVAQLLVAGIDVWTTLNVANIASLSHVVAEITGVHPAEPVPDEFLRSGEIRLVDLEPSALRHRLAQGLVFPKERADTALANYFRYANLASLRELTQLWLDDGIENPEAVFSLHHDETDHDASVVVVGLDASADDEWLARYAASLAELSGGTLVAVHVRGEDSRSRRQIAQLEYDRGLLRTLHADFQEVRAPDIAAGLVDAARDAKATQLVVGSRGRSRWSRLLRGSTVGQVLRLAENLPIQVVNVGRSEKGTSDAEASRTPSS
jgi:two-component system sensor histidine kinase KdpD